MIIIFWLDYLAYPIRIYNAINCYKDVYIDKCNTITL